MALIECYFTEIRSHEGSPVTCVAAYLFDREQRLEFEHKWKKILGRYGLPYFQMSDCVYHRDHFASIAQRKCIEIENEMIRAIGEHALLGLAIAVSETDYNSCSEGEGPNASAYTFCCWQVLRGVHDWARKTQSVGEIIYFFEASQTSRGEASAFMERVLNTPRLRVRYRYAGHEFVSKQKAMALQAADILAWHQATQMKSWLKKDYGIRADFQALQAKPHHDLFMAGRRAVSGVLAYQRQLKGLPVGGITGQFGSAWFWCPFDGSEGFCSASAGRGLPHLPIAFSYGAPPPAQTSK